MLGSGAGGKLRLQPWRSRRRRRRLALPPPPPPSLSPPPAGNDAERNITNTCGVPEIGPPADSAASLVSDLLDNIKADKPGNGTAAR